MSNSNGNNLFHQMYDLDKNQGDAKKVVIPPTANYPAEKLNAGVPAKKGPVKPANTGKTVPDRTESMKKMTEPKESQSAEPDEPDFKLEFTSNSMMNGLILSEVLGKPKILQKRRW